MKTRTGIVVVVTIIILLVMVDISGAAPFGFRNVISMFIRTGEVTAFEWEGGLLCIVSHSRDGSDVEQDCFCPCFERPCEPGTVFVEPKNIPLFTPTPPSIFPTDEPAPKQDPTNTPSPTERPGEPTYTPSPPTNTPPPTATSKPFWPTPTPKPEPTPTMRGLFPTKTPEPTVMSPTAEPKCKEGKVLVCHNGHEICVSVNAAWPHGPHGRAHGGVVCYMGPCQ